MNMNTTYEFTRNNMALTVYVPYDCKNNCPFCVSKGLYKQCKSNPTVLIEQFKKCLQLKDIKDVVFTGGEPTENISLLTLMCEMASNANKNVFINTTLPIDSYAGFAGLCQTGYVTAVNVSRHEEDFIADSEKFYNLSTDKQIAALPVPVRINVVITDKMTTQKIDNIIQRWEPYKNIEVSFREDFRKTTIASLHNPSNGELLDYLYQHYRFINHTYCEVCDTLLFEGNIRYHRGLEHSSMKFGSSLHINDIIIFPNGDICYDWDYKKIDTLPNFWEQMLSKKVTVQKKNNNNISRHFKEKPYYEDKHTVRGC